MHASSESRGDRRIHPGRGRRLAASRANPGRSDRGRTRTRPTAAASPRLTARSRSEASCSSAAASAAGSSGGTTTPPPLASTKRAPHRWRRARPAARRPSPPAFRRHRPANRGLSAAARRLRWRRPAARHLRVGTALTVRAFDSRSARARSSEPRRRRRRRSPRRGIRSRASTASSRVPTPAPSRRAGVENEERTGVGRAAPARTPAGRPRARSGAPCAASGRIRGARRCLRWAPMLRRPVAAALEPGRADRGRPQRPELDRRVGPEVGDVDHQQRALRRA